MMVRESKCKSDDFAIFYVYPIQLLEYQTDVRRCRFDTLGKLTPAHRAGAPTAREHGDHGEYGGQGSISLEYQTYNPHIRLIL